MAKGAAREKELGALHLMLTQVFIKVLTKYEKDLDRVPTEVEATEEAAMELIDSGVTINPAMLTAVAKFLKDNEIKFDNEALEQLGSLDRRLKDKLDRRKTVNLSDIPLIDMRSA